MIVRVTNWFPGIRLWDRLYFNHAFSRIEYKLITWGVNPASSSHVSMMNFSIMAGFFVSPRRLDGVKQAFCAICWIAITVVSWPVYSGCSPGLLLKRRCTRWWCCSVSFSPVAHWWKTSGQPLFHLFFSSLSWIWPGDVASSEMHVDTWLPVFPPPGICSTCHPPGSCWARGERLTPAYTQI